MELNMVKELMFIQIMIYFLDGGNLEKNKELELMFIMVVE
jgi:hypothetical protein